MIRYVYGILAIALLIGADKNGEPGRRSSNIKLSNYIKSISLFCYHEKSQDYKSVVTVFKVEVTMESSGGHILVS